MLGSMESTSDPCCGPTNSATLLFPVSLITSKSKSNPINLCGNSTSAVSHTSSNDFLQTLVLAPRQRRKTAASAKNSSCFFLSLLNHTVCLSVSLFQLGGSCNKQKDNQQEFAPFSSALCADLSFSVSPCLSAFLLIPIGWLDIFRRVSTCQSTTASVSLCCAVVFKCWECMSKPYPHSPPPPLPSQLTNN